MKVTLPAKGKEGSPRYREKKTYTLSVKQVLALQQAFFVSAEETIGVLGKQAKQVMSSLVTLGLFKEKRDESYARTSLGLELVEHLNERV